MSTFFEAASRDGSVMTVGMRVSVLDTRSDSETLEPEGVPDGPETSMELDVSEDVDEPRTAAFLGVPELDKAEESRSVRPEGVMLPSRAVSSSS
jgi:hypothetical protein